jgi:hypothetical protein
VKIKVAASERWMDERRTCSRKIRGGVSESSKALLEKVQVTLAEVAAINVLAALLEKGQTSLVWYKKPCYIL